MTSYEKRQYQIQGLPRVWIHGSLRMQECTDESNIYNYQRIQLSNNKFINGIFGVRLTWVDCNIIDNQANQKQFQTFLKSTRILFQAKLFLNLSKSPSKVIIGKMVASLHTD